MFAAYQKRTEEMTRPWRDVGLQSLDAIERGMKSGVFARSPWRPPAYRSRSLRGTWLGGFLTPYQDKSVAQQARDLPTFRDLPEDRWGLADDVQTEANVVNFNRRATRSPGHPTRCNSWREPAQGSRHWWHPRQSQSNGQGHGNGGRPPPQRTVPPISEQPDGYRLWPWHLLDLALARSATGPATGDTGEGTDPGASPVSPAPGELRRRRTDTGASAADDRRISPALMLECLQAWATTPAPVMAGDTGTGVGAGDDTGWWHSWAWTWFRRHVPSRALRPRRNRTHWAAGSADGSDDTRGKPITSLLESR